MDDDSREDMEISRGTYKRTRSQLRTDSKLSATNGGENRETAEDARQESPDKVENLSFPDDILPEVKRSRPFRREPTASDMSNQRLFEVVKGSGKQTLHVIKLWLERYEKNTKAALVELLAMLFEACGAKYIIKEDLLDDTVVDDVVVALVDLARRGEVVDFLTSKKDFKAFKDNLVLFWDNLVVESQDGPLFDKVLFEKCMDYVITLSCTPPRVYRQLASWVGLQLVTSFIKVAKTLGMQRETTQRQLNAEKKKRAEGPRVVSLTKRLSTSHDKILVLEEMMRKMFTGLFVHRYRDVDPNIRMSCIEALGVWVLSYPSLFLQDLYLKYLGWTLNDKNAGVRKASVLALQSLYEVDDNIPSLTLFAERFSGRMIELADDIDVSVAVCAVGLVRQLLRDHLLSDDDLAPLYDLLIDDVPDIRHAIGELVYEHLIAQKFNSSQSLSQGSHDTSSEVYITRALQILREFSSDPILSFYVIDDVWDCMKAMQDWKCIISMLMGENPTIELSDDDATNLVRLLFASVRKSVGDRIVPAADNRKQHCNKAQKEVFEKHRRDITIVMMKNYPGLLGKYLADRVKLPSLVEIVLHLNLEIYSLKRQDQNFRSLLQLIKDAFFKHGEKETLRSCVKAVLFCFNRSHGELKDFACELLKKLEDELIMKIASAMKDEDGDEYSLLVNMKRLYELQLSSAVPLESHFGDMIETLHRLRGTNNEVISFLLLNIHLHVAWTLQHATNCEVVSDNSVSSLLLKRDALFKELEYFLNAPECMEGGKYEAQLACRVCIVAAEAWCFFRKENFASTKLECWGYCPGIDILQKFWKLCEQVLGKKVENEDEEYIEDTNRDAVMIAAAKLIVTNTVSKDYLFPEIISHLSLHGPDISEIIKHLITYVKKVDGDVSSFFLQALVRAYHRHLVDDTGTHQTLTRRYFAEFKELASRLSGIFVGAARSKLRADVLKLVKEGIEYAFTDAPKKLPFLEGAILQFVSKLPTPDILEVLKDVRGRAENANTSADPSGWQPCYAFIEILKEKYVKYQDEKAGPPSRRGGRPRKRANIEGKRLFDDESSGEDDSISMSDQDAVGDEKKQDDGSDGEDAHLANSTRASSRLRSIKIPGNEDNSGGRRATGVSPSTRTSAVAN